jgi:hypothetical protein
MTEAQKATLASAVSATGTIDTVRAHVHTFAGIIGDLGGAAITILTLLWWIRLWLRRNTTGSVSHEAPGPRPPTP